MQIKATPKGSISFDWYDQPSLLIDRDSYVFEDLPPQLVDFVKTRLRNNATIVVTGGHFPRDIRSYWEGLVAVLKLAESQFDVRFDVPQLAIEGPPDVY